MKRLLSVFVLAIVAVQFVCAGDVVTQDVNRLPQAARQFIEKYFPSARVSYIKIDSEFMRGDTYEVLLTDQTEIDFDSKGSWQEVDCKKKAVPAALVPETVKEYVKVNFPREIITQIDRRRGVEVELGNDFSLKFNKKGKFVGMDD